MDFLQGPKSTRLFYNRDYIRQCWPQLIIKNLYLYSFKYEKIVHDYEQQSMKGVMIYGVCSAFSVSEDSVLLISKVENNPFNHQNNTY